MNKKFFLSPFVLEIPINDECILLFNKLNYSLVKIKKKLWMELKTRIEKGEDITDFTSFPEYSKIIEELIKRDFILHDHSNEDFSEYIKKIPMILEYTLNEIRFRHPAISLFISVTSRCNLACKYCYLSKKPGKDLTIDTASRILKFIVKSIERSKGLIKGISVAYFGGEPLLRFDIIKFLHVNLEKISLENGLKLHEHIITNGTLLTKEVIEELNSWNSNLGIQITLDGTKEFHDKLRVYKDGRGSFDDIYKGFIKLIDEFEKGNITLRCNVNDENFAAIPELLRQIKHDVGHRVSRVSVDFSWIFPQQHYFVECGGAFSYDISATQKLLQLYKVAHELGFKLSLLTIIRGPCIGKIFYGYAIDEEGRVYKCPGLFYTNKYFASLDDEGNLKISSQIQFVNNFISFLMSERKCYLTCEYGPLCYGGCVTMRTCPKNYFKVFIPEYLKLLAERNERR